VARVTGVIVASGNGASALPIGMRILAYRAARPSRTAPTGTGGTGGAGGVVGP